MRKDIDTHEEYAQPLTNSTEKVYNKAQKAAEKDNWAAYKAGHVPGGGKWGDDGRVGAFYTGVDFMIANQPDLNQLIHPNPGTDGN